MSDEFDDALDDLGPDRRTFVRRVVVGTAFAAPLVASFTMSGVQAAYAQTPAASGPSRTSPSTSTSTSTTTTSTTTTTRPNTTTTTLNGNQPAPAPAPE